MKASTVKFICSLSILFTQSKYFKEGGIRATKEDQRERLLLLIEATILPYSELFNLSIENLWTNENSAILGGKLKLSQSNRLCMHSGKQNNHC